MEVMNRFAKVRHSMLLNLLCCAFIVSPTSWSSGNALVLESGGPNLNLGPVKLDTE